MGHPVGDISVIRLRKTFWKLKKVRAASDTLRADKSSDVSFCTMNRVPAQVTPPEVGLQIRAHLAELNSG